MNVFITGGSGLVGSHAIQLLTTHGHGVRALVRDAAGKDLVESLGATAVFGTVEDRDSWIPAAGTDAIVHAAAVIAPRRRWDTFHSINVDGARNAAVTASKNGIRLVHISSVAVYGRRKRTGAERIDETREWTELAKPEFYALSKRRAEEAIASISREIALSVVTLRPCVIYGERDRTFLPHVIRVLRFGIAPLVGSGSNTLAIVYAGNVATAVLSALEHPEVEGPMNVANDGDVTQRDFFTAVSAALNKRTRFVRIPVPIARAFAATAQGLRMLLAPRKYAGFGATAAEYLSSDNPYSSDRARRELGWLPAIPPEKAIRRSVRWFDEQQ